MKLLELKRVIAGAENTLVVAFQDDALIGSVEVRCGAIVARIRALFVDEKYRRRGIGRALINRCMEIAAAANCESLALVCWLGNQPAIQLYKRLGFIICSEDEAELELVKSV